MNIKQANYTIVSAPRSIKFICPYCRVGNEIDVDDIDSDTLWYGGIVECSDCNRDIELTDWEYD